MYCWWSRRCRGSWEVGRERIEVEVWAVGRMLGVGIDFFTPTQTDRCDTDCAVALRVYHESSVVTESKSKKS